MGVVWILEGGEPLSELDRRAAEYAALVAAIHIAHQRELAALEATLGYASVLSLLESESDPTAAAQERVRLLGFDPEVPYRVAIVVFPEEMPLGREGFLRRDRVAGASAILKGMGAQQLVAVTLNRVPLLLPANVGLDAMLKALNDESVTIVAGREYVGAAGARRSYREALSLVRHRSRKRVCNFDDVLVPRVISGDAEARRTFISDLLRPLQSQRGGSALVDAVLALARNGFRMRETAEELAIHPNTLRYRLNRASEMLDLQFDRADVRFSLQLAARLLEFEDPSGAAAPQPPMRKR